MRAQMHVILQAAYNDHQRNTTPCARVRRGRERPMSFDASWTTVRLIAQRVIYFINCESPLM